MLSEPADEPLSAEDHALAVRLHAHLLTLVPGAEREGTYGVSVVRLGRFCVCRAHASSAEGRVVSRRFEVVVSEATAGEALRVAARLSGLAEGGA